MNRRLAAEMTRPCVENLGNSTRLPALFALIRDIASRHPSGPEFIRGFLDFRWSRRLKEKPFEYGQVSIIDNAIAIQVRIRNIAEEFDLEERQAGSIDDQVIVEVRVAAIAITVVVAVALRAIINPATIYIVFGHRVPVLGKAALRPLARARHSLRAAHWSLNPQRILLSRKYTWVLRSFVKSFVNPILYTIIPPSW